MFITPINRLDSISDLNAISNKTATDKSTKSSDFRNIFNQVIDNVKESEETLSNEQYLFVTGQSQDTHSLEIAATKAQISVDLLIAIRNKALDSYNELMRINL
ncbi:Flagellar hook-basal body complex protein FliE [bioreactor metagenome]|uniref:Flagellar hook-basal body complex protein FliE n=1 Tax=bioreactor metagenome TaxID=1076179 RepID=A0A645ESA9_9ZZZZ|nr:flagellar hook-basal body complex protein FliE [Candidatus Metalachnospira sp.]